MWHVRSRGWGGPVRHRDAAGPRARCSGRSRRTPPRCVPWARSARSTCTASTRARRRPWAAPDPTPPNIIDVLRARIVSLPADRRDDLVITSDGAGGSHPLIGWLHSLDRAPGRRVAYSVGFDLDQHVRAAANYRRDQWWLPCLSNSSGDLVEGLECTEITDLLRARLRDLDWPASMRVIVRRRKLYPHEQPTLFDTGGYRYSC